MPKKKQYRNGLFSGGNCPPPEYWILMSIRDRCFNKKCWAYKWYGGRGIKVCQRWDDPKLFLEDMGPRPSPQHTIERLDNDGDYEPGNCSWVTMKVQCQNRRNGIRINGLTLYEIADALGMTYSGVYGRHSRGWSLERIAQEKKIEDGRRSCNNMLTIGKVTKPVTQWAKENDMPAHRLFGRIYKGWPKERLLVGKVR